MRIKIFNDGEEYIPDYEEPKATSIEMWYDRHYRHWVIYPVDEFGNQLAEAQYGFGKQEANKIKAELADEYGI